MTTSIHSFLLESIPIELELSEETFKPTLITKMISKHVPIPQSGSVLDLGCGVGVLAIFAARKGAGRVIAVDVMEQACKLATTNVLRNGVSDRVSVICGSLFEPVKSEKFDLVINDVSGVAEEVARLSPWYPPTIPTGGLDGADVIVPMLLESPNHLNPGGAIYFPTGSISNVARTLAAAKEAFGENILLIDEMDVPFCEEFNQDLDTMYRLKSDGIIDFTSRRSRHLWQLQLYKAWL